MSCRQLMAVDNVNKLNLITEFKIKKKLSACLIFLFQNLARSLIFKAKLICKTNFDIIYFPFYVNTFLHI